MSLNAIELALIAEHSLEMARANQAVADDERRDPRHVERRPRWRLPGDNVPSCFRCEARRRSAYPIVPGVHGRFAP